ncbi:hypothetical protein P7C70_g8856, partial [Phenoliferia sp. Uapishka_3]
MQPPAASSSEFGSDDDDDLYRNLVITFQPSNPPPSSTSNLPRTHPAPASTHTSPPSTANTDLPPNQTSRAIHNALPNSNPSPSIPQRFPDASSSSTGASELTGKRRAPSPGSAVDLAVTKKHRGRPKKVLSEADQLKLAQMEERRSQRARKKAENVDLVRQRTSGAANPARDRDGEASGTSVPAARTLGRPAFTAEKKAAKEAEREEKRRRVEDDAVRERKEADVREAARLKRLHEANLALSKTDARFPMLDDMSSNSQGSSRQVQQTALSFSTTPTSTSSHSSTLTPHLPPPTPSTPTPTLPIPSILHRRIIPEENIWRAFQDRETTPDDTHDANGAGVGLEG